MPDSFYSIIEEIKKSATDMRNLAMFYGVADEGSKEEALYCRAMNEARTKFETAISYLEKIKDIEKKYSK